MRILAIETSCDETALALVEGQNIQEGPGGGFVFTVLKSALISQAMLHSPYGGVYPNLAKREHIKNLPVLFEKFKDDTYDAIAVTRGPGLEPALWTGIEFAKKLAAEKNIPLIPVNHMEGHLLSSLVKTGKLEDVKLPVLALLISGGHTEFVLMRNWFSYEIIGKTLDDAVGEAYDKVARMLGLPYPGGPEISKLAERARGERGGAVDASAASCQGEQERLPLSLPRPMLNTKDNNVSFSGLKTAVLYALRDRGGIQKLNAEEIIDFAREFEDAATEVLVHKTKRALEETGAQTFVIGGGVAANKHIRESLQNLIKEKFSYFAEASKDANGVEMRLPELNITGDNAIMIAEAALARALSGINDATGGEIAAKGNLSIENK